jgi:phosphoribosylanthranilate isomerase
MKYRIKICGLTKQEDVQSAVSLGADALGFVFYHASPRAVSIKDAASLIKSLPPFVTTVGLFVNATANEVNDAIKHCALDLLQFHGNETPDYCKQFSRPYIKAIRVSSQHDIIKASKLYHGAKALLLDAFVEGVEGGTGKSFDWSLIPEFISLPWVLAGGLTEKNIYQCLKDVHPYAVDVSSGVERSLGLKDVNKMQHFIKEVHRAEY